MLFKAGQKRYAIQNTLERDFGEDDRKWKIKLFKF